MRWSVDTNIPPLAGKGATITCDGVEVPHVTAFDTDEGWVEALCDHGGKPHRDPSNPEEICRRVLHGKVEVVMPKEAR